MRIHIIAVGGAVMHNLALELQRNGHIVSGSDDEIYNPALDRLGKAGLLPQSFGWFEDKITEELDFVILGMHARADNPELLRAQALGIRVYSYPAFIYQHASDKKRIVVAGSHGKTTTTSMIMHVLRVCGVDFDYLVGAQLEGFDLMVRLSDAPWMVIEGDEYLSSPLDRVPKMLHYKPHLAIVTGVAWDHMNVFPTEQSYLDQFKAFISGMEAGGKLFYFQGDEKLGRLVAETASEAETIPYGTLDFSTEEEGIELIDAQGTHYPAKVFGRHNLQNMQAARQLLLEAGLEDSAIVEALASFSGAAKRLQVLARNGKDIAFLDFAHAPSKVKATVAAVREQFPDRRIRGVLELHTFSSLNPAFLPQYAGSLDGLDEAVVFYDAHTIAMKQMAPLDPVFVQSCFQNPAVRVIDQIDVFRDYLQAMPFKGEITLLMSSGPLGKISVQELASTKLS